MRPTQVYYSVFTLKDGTVYFVVPVRKPRKTRHSRAPKIDEDGICQRFIEKKVEVKDLPDWAKGAWHTALSTCLNVKRIVREQVEARLKGIEQEVQSLRNQLDRIEGKIDKLCSGQRE